MGFKPLLVTQWGEAAPLRHQGLGVQCCVQGHLDKLLGEIRNKTTNPGVRRRQLHKTFSMYCP